MHPYVYKKHHKPHHLIELVILYCIMILCQQVSSCPNYPVKKVKIFSEFSKGHVRIEGTRVMASECKHNCLDPKTLEKNFLYKVTIDKHYMLLYHIKTEKFICWNKLFKKLVARRNPTNLTYCKFEDNLSKIRDYKGSKIRYTTKDSNGMEVEIRFNRSGAFAKSKFIEKCVRHFALHEKLGLKVRDFVRLNPATITEGSKEMSAYKLLMRKCANPDFLRSDVEKCDSGVPEFCEKMKSLTNKGHSISSEIMDLCKHVWSKNN